MNTQNNTTVSSGERGGQNTSVAAGGAPTQTGSGDISSKLATVASFATPSGLEKFVRTSGASTFRPQNKKMFIAARKKEAEDAGLTFEMKKAKAEYKAYLETVRTRLKSVAIQAIAEERMVPMSLNANKSGVFTNIGLMRPARADAMASERAVEKVKGQFRSATAQKIIEDALKAAAAVEKNENANTIDVQASQPAQQQTEQNQPEAVATSR